MCFIDFNARSYITPTDNIEMTQIRPVLKKELHIIKAATFSQNSMFMENTMLLMDVGESINPTRNIESCCNFKMILHVMRLLLTLINARKPVYGVCEHRRRRPAFGSA